MGKKMKLLGAGLWFALLLAGCGVQADYTTAQFEDAISSGELTDGKTVAVEVVDVYPNDAFGFVMKAGENLHFVSVNKPDVEPGDIVVVRVERAAGIFGSYIITYTFE